MPKPPEGPTNSSAWLESLTPLQLRPSGMWDPTEHDRGESFAVNEDCLKPVIERGPRRMFEKEQVLPGGGRPR